MFFHVFYLTMKLTNFNINLGTLFMSGEPLVRLLRLPRSSPVRLPRSVRPIPPTSFLRTDGGNWHATKRGTLVANFGR